MSPRWRRLAAAAARLGISALLVWLAVRLVDGPKVASSLRGLAWSWMALGAALYLGCILLAVTRWWLILGEVGARPSWTALVGHYFVGLLFNLFLPGALGGDLARGVRLYREVDRPAEIAVSVLVDRVIGLLAMFVVGTAFLAFSPAVRGTDLALWFGGIGGAVALGFGVVAWGRTRALGLQLARTLPIAGVARIAEALDAAMGAVSPRRPAFQLACALAVGTHLGQTLVHGCVSRALGAGVGLGVLALYYPLVSMVSLIPLTIGGIGLREYAGARLFEASGHDPATAVALSLAWFAIAVGWSLAGAVPLVWPRR